MKLNCIIIDDEQPARRLLENYCSKIETLQVVGAYKSAIEALPILNGKNVDIIFLDIQMPELSGIDFLKSINTFNTKVVFTTAYRDYALEGFELNAIDYLVKPIEFHRFLRAVEKVKEIHQKPQKLEIKAIEKPLIIKANKKQYKVPLQEVLYIKSENEYIKYVTQNQGNLMVHGALKNIEKSFGDTSNFLRIHRSYIVNLSHITYVEGSRVRINGDYFSISEKYRASFFKKWK